MPDAPLRSGLYIEKLPRIFVPLFLRGDHPGELAEPTVSLAPRAANEAIFVPFEVENRLDVTGINHIVNVSAGNYDVGIYDQAGNLIVSKGTTAVPAAGVANGAFSGTQRLTRGRYFAAAVWSDTGTMRFSGQAFNTILAVELEGHGFKQMAAALALPATATFAVPAWIHVPILSLELA